jgi:hypothetical protein
VEDTCTGLEWEKKTHGPGLHDVDQYFAWAGCCNNDCSNDANLCQPNDAAAATCAAHADGGVLGCATCATGFCGIAPGIVTTVWDWVSQLNATNFAGHGDWRLPSEGAHNTPPTGPAELETILLAPFVCDVGFVRSCIDPRFGPTKYPNGFYWTATTVYFEPFEYGLAYFVGFDFGRIGADGKNSAGYVRAVR